MSVSAVNIRTGIRMRLRRRLASESGFTMLVALMVLMVVTLLIGAAFVAAQGDVNNSRHDLDGKRAFYAARAGLNRFLYLLNKDNELWTQCPTAGVPTPAQVPGGATDLKYSYQPLPANASIACATNPAGRMIDLSTGSFRMQFTGIAGPTAAPVRRTIVAQFKRSSPLDYLWYSTYETLDPNTRSDPSDYQDCAAFIRTPRPSHCGNIQWISGDDVNGPMYTHDQFFICGSPTFGRANSQDRVESASDTGSSVVLSSSCTNNPTYYGAAGNPQTAPVEVPAPSDNTNLLPYATAAGKVYTGRTSITLNGTTATVTNATAPGCSSSCSVNLATYPIIYVNNGAGCSATYSPYFAGTGNYTAATTCGNVLISGTYSTPITIAAANDIIIKEDITTTLTGSAVAGLVANNFIRVMHAVDSRSDTTFNGQTYYNCDSGDDNVAGYTLTGLRIDAAVLALKHSFIVDNYDCGEPITGDLTVNGAIAQLFRGTVGTGGGGNVSTGYLKNYNYDDRFAFLQPPYLFDLAESAWQPIRETTCDPGNTNPLLAC